MTPPARPARKGRLTVDESLVRRDRIFARLTDGQSYAAIAAAEAITPRRLRQIVHEGLNRSNFDPRDDFALVQIARLEHALSAIMREIDEGKLAAVDRMLKVLAELDRYHKPAAPPSAYRFQSPAESRTRLERAVAARDAVASRPPAPRLSLPAPEAAPKSAQAPDLARSAASYGPWPASMSRT
jgi:hypothetical protein